MQRADAAVTYESYLSLDEILGAQHPRTQEHDELLFIVIHQVYELWFKQLLHETARLQERLEAGAGPQALGALRRMLAILKTVVGQLDVLETMTPTQFAAFRDRLGSASGFQSAQFRELEAALGRRDRRVLAQYEPASRPYVRIDAAMRRPCVFDSLLRYLASHGFAVPPAALARPVEEPLEESEQVQALLIDVYRAEGEAAQMCERLVDLDEGLQEWRYRHVKMVERIIGARGGTGGSSGAAYLRRTLFAPAFPDLWAVRSRL